jgi:hypothetical protein
MTELQGHIEHTKGNVLCFGARYDIHAHVHVCAVLWRQMLLSGASAPDIACGASAPALIYCTAVLRRQIGDW